MFSIILRVLVCFFSAPIFTIGIIALPNWPVPEWMDKYQLAVSLSLHAFGVLSGLLIITLSLLSRKKDSNRLDFAISLVCVLLFVAIIAGPWIIENVPDDWIQNDYAYDHAAVIFSVVAASIWMVIATYPLWSAKVRREKKEALETFQ
jgi:formate hydrogenlyase subunit 3/multisubunit Na+/H+ antiporter MnhD subunit